MEALSPTSGSADSVKPKVCRVPVKRAAIADAHAPSVSVPLRFVLTGLAALFAAVAILIARPDLLATYHYGPHIIAVTHLLVLGWLATLAMGAMYQLVPVALETRLYSERLAKIQFALHVIGFVGMVWTFWIWNMKEVGHWGSALALGVILFVYNLGRTLGRIPRWNVVAFTIAAAAFWLFITICAGLFAVAAKCWPQISPFNPISLMHAHAHLGGLGFFMMIIVGVSYKLVPMFLLGEIQSPRRAWGSVALLNLGLVALFPTMLFDSRWKLPCALVVVAGLALYGWEMAAIVRPRKRGGLDWGLKSFLTALVLLAPLAVIGLVLCWPGLPMTERIGQLENVYGILAVLGVFSFAILGMLYKIIPFLVWYAAYSKHVGRARVPSLVDLYSTRWQVLGYWTWLAGLGVLCGGTFFAHEKAVQAGSVVLGLSLVAFALNTVMMLSHLVRPRMIALNLNTPAPAAALS